MIILVSITKVVVVMEVVVLERVLVDEMVCVAEVVVADRVVVDVIVMVVEVGGMYKASNPKPTNRKHANGTGHRPLNTYNPHEIIVNLTTEQRLRPHHSPTRHS